MKVSQFVRRLVLIMVKARTQAACAPHGGILTGAHVQALQEMDLSSLEDDVTSIAGWLISSAMEEEHEDPDVHHDDEDEERGDAAIESEDDVLDFAEAADVEAEVRKGEHIIELDDDSLSMGRTRLHMNLRDAHGKLLPKEKRAKYEEHYWLSNDDIKYVRSAMLVDTIVDEDAKCPAILKRTIDCTYHNLNRRNGWQMQLCTTSDTGPMKSTSKQR